MPQRQTLTVYSRLTITKVKIFSCRSIGRLYLGFSSFTSLSLQKSFFTTNDWNLGPQFSIHMSSSCTHKKLLLDTRKKKSTKQLDCFCFLLFNLFQMLWGSVQMDMNGLLPAISVECLMRLLQGTVTHCVHCYTNTIQNEMC